MIDYERFRSAPLVREPFEHVVVGGFLRSDSLPGIVSSFPSIRRGGSFPVSELSSGEDFSRLIDELREPELRRAVEEKFGIELTGRPTLITVRGQARKKDGRIHTDTATKIITVLMYLNPGWSDAGGHLRLLRSSTSLEDYVADVAPEAGTAVFFRCAGNAWHGHTPFVGERRAVQLNWVRDGAVVAREERRHRFSARLKNWLPL